LGEAALAKEKKTVDETESARRCLQNASVALDRTKRNRADEIHLSKRMPLCRLTKHHRHEGKWRMLRRECCAPIHAFEGADPRGRIF
jgi:hypothetical protein